MLKHSAFSGLKALFKAHNSSKPLKSIFHNARGSQCIGLVSADNVAGYSYNAIAGALWWFQAGLFGIIQEHIRVKM